METKFKVGDLVWYETFFWTHYFKGGIVSGVCECEGKVCYTLKGVFRGFYHYNLFKEPPKDEIYKDYFNK